MALRHGERRTLDKKGSAVHNQRCPLRQGVAFFFSLCVLLTAVTHGLAADILASNKQPLAFGPGQTIIDLKRIVWEPLKGEGIPPGAKIATLRGDLAKGGGELLVYLPPNYTFPNHSHTSEELYVWIQGNFTYIAADGTATPLSGTTYISLPPEVPHALRCGKQSCVFYVRYPGPFDYKIHPMPARKK
jgi:quercetin dioxygenase-like cupin family protein